MTHFELDDAQRLIDWLLERGISIGESAHVLSDMECGDSLSLALLKVFKHRELSVQKLNEHFDWGMPLTP